VAAKLPGWGVSLVKKGATETGEFDFIGQVRDPKRRLVGSLRDTIRVKLSETDALALSHRHLHYDTGFTLPPGEYRIKFLARDNQSGKMGAFETAFTVPDLKQEMEKLRLSSVILGHQREPVSAAVGTAGAKDKDQLQAQHPLVQDGKKLIPSVTRVFRRNQVLHVFFEAYDAARVAASVSFYRGRAKVFEASPLRRTETSRPNVIPFEFQIPLDKLKPGRYTCQLTAIDEAARRFAFRRASLAVLP
jgi:hypothetical protein